MWFRLLVTVLLAVIFLSILTNYVREVWVFFTRRSEYDALDKLTIREGEDGDGKEITTAAARLAFAYPVLIIVGGMVTIGLGHRVISEIFG